MKPRITPGRVGTVQKSMKASSVSLRDSSSSIPLTSWIKFSRFSITLIVGRRMGDVGGEGDKVGAAAFRVIMSPRLAITDLDLVILGCGCSVAGCDCEEVTSLFWLADVGVRGKVDFPPSNGLSAKSFAMALHIEPNSLPTDFLALLIEPELLLLDWKMPVDILLLFSLFSTKASKPAEPIVALLSLLGFHVLDSVVLGSGLSGMVSWTSSSSSESRPVALPRREERDLTLPVRLITASILSLLSSSLGVGRVEELDVVMVGDRAGRLDLLAIDCMLSRVTDLPRGASSSVSLRSVVVRFTTSGGSRLLSRDEGDGVSSGRFADEGDGESGRGIARGSTGSGRGREGSSLSFSDGSTSSSGMSWKEEVSGIGESEMGFLRLGRRPSDGRAVSSRGFGS